MRAKTELFLYRLMWLAEKPMAPTFRNLEMGFEGWAYRNGLLRQIRRLEAQGFLESQIDSRTGKRLHRLTEAGRLAAIGGRDPEDEWNASWDGKWRLFLFDIPEGQSWRRRKLTRALAEAGSVGHYLSWPRQIMSCKSGAGPAVWGSLNSGEDELARSGDRQSRWLGCPS